MILLISASNTYASTAGLTAGQSCSGGTQTRISGSQTTVHSIAQGGLAECHALCVANGNSGCCRYAQGIPSYEENAALGITTSNGGRCWILPNGALTTGDSTTAGGMLGGS